MGKRVFGMYYFLYIDHHRTYPDNNIRYIYNNNTFAACFYIKWEINNIYSIIVVYTFRISISINDNNWIYIVYCLFANINVYMIINGSI